MRWSFRAGASSGAPRKGQRQALKRLHRHVRDVGDLFGRDGELDVVQPLDDFLRRDLELHPGKSCADAAVNAGAECQMLADILAIDVEALRTREDRLIVV